MSNVQGAVIFDMDGTLCDVRSIRHLIDEKGFDAFHYASASCPPIDWVAQAAKEYHAEGIAVLVVTGRVRKFKSLTAFWLADHGIPSDELETRRDGDFRKDFVIKKEILKRLRQKYNIIRAYDDNPQVIDLWLNEGIPVTVVPGWDGPV